MPLGVLNRSAETWDCCCWAKWPKWLSWQTNPPVLVELRPLTCLTHYVRTLPSLNYDWGSKASKPMLVDYLGLAACREAISRSKALSRARRDFDAARARLRSTSEVSWRRTPPKKIILCGQPHWFYLRRRESWSVTNVKMQMERVGCLLFFRPSHEAQCQQLSVSHPRLLWLGSNAKPGWTVGTEMPFSGSATTWFYWQFMMVTDTSVLWPFFDTDF